MTIETKFDIGDTAWYKQDDKWYLVEILDVHVIKLKRPITGEIITDIRYWSQFKEITGKPKEGVLPDGTNIIREEELYKYKGESE